MSPRNIAREGRSRQRSGGSKGNMGKVEHYLLQKLQEKGALHITLFDPENISVQDAVVASQQAEMGGSDAIMIGGSTFVETALLDKFVKAIKRAVRIPTLIFPNNVSAISQYADAIWFMSLLNSMNPYFISGAQSLAAPLIRKYGLEAIPVGYIIVGNGGAAALIGQARPIPYDKHEIIVSYALAAELLGMHFVYLEAGSGASKPIPPFVIKKTKEALTIPLIVGGGIRSYKDSYEAVKAGADIIVTGNLVEEEVDIKAKVSELCEGIKNAVRERTSE